MKVLINKIENTSSPIIDNINMQQLQKKSDRKEKNSKRKENLLDTIKLILIWFDLILSYAILQMGEVCLLLQILLFFYLQLHFPSKQAKQQLNIGCHW